MESLCMSPHIPNPLHLLSGPSTPKTLTPIAVKPSHRKLTISLRSSRDPIQTPKTLATTLSSILKPAAAAAITAATLLLSAAGIRTPTAAASAAASAAPPAPHSETLPSETLTDAEKARALEEHLDSHPTDESALRSLMELKVKSGKFPEAIAAVDRLAALHPNEKSLPLLRAHLQSYSGDTESARQAFEAILAKDPFFVEAYHGLVMAASQSDGELGEVLKRVEAAMEMCEKAGRKEDLRDFKLLMAQIRVIEGKFEDALHVYEELVKDEPKDFRPYLCQGIIYTLMRKKGEAEKQFKKYRRLVPKGHPYAQYFDDNMAAMKAFSQINENKRKGSLKN